MVFSSKLKKILITGGNSRFGCILKKKFNGKNIIYTGKEDLNILCLDSIDNSLNKHKPDCLIHLASLSRPMEIHEKNISLSIDLNIIGTANIVKRCAEKKIKLIYFSTAYVYPGTRGHYDENDSIKPINNYAWSKLGGETSVILYKNSLILRLAMTEYPFVHKKAFSDAKANFIYANEVAEILPKILNEKGVINIGSLEAESIYNFAKKSNDKVKPTSIKNVKYFPKDSSVNVEKLNKILNRKAKLKKSFLAAGPNISKIERETVEDMMYNGWDNYNYVQKFELEFAKYHRRKYCLMTPSCTLAIYLALKSINLKSGDEVIVPDSTWTATVSPIVECGAIPIFVDVNKSNWCIDIKKIKKEINKKTKAIFCVDLFGNIGEVNKLKKICKKNNILFLEDAAEALGSKLRGVRAGKFGEISFHSFHRTKTITSGEGGALLTDNKKIFEKAKHLRDLGRSKKNSYFAETSSLKFMPSNFQAAMAYGQFKRIDELLKIKRNIFKSYKKYLKNINLKFNCDNNKIVNGLWATVIKFDSKYKIDILKLIKFLKNKNIYARSFFSPLSSQNAYKKFVKNKKINPISRELYESSLVLPSHYNLNDLDIKFISDNIVKYIKNLKT